MHLLNKKFVDFSELWTLKHMRHSASDRPGLVATNGCFDILHAGHTEYLEQARELGRCLVVGINSDRAVRELKGPTRPVNTELDRAKVLAALECVDYVTIFDSVRATQFLKSVRPHIYVKGGDYALETLDPEERAALQEMGVDIQFVPLVPGKSTTQVLKLCQ